MGFKEPDSSDTDVSFVLRSPEGERSRLVSDPRAFDLAASKIIEDVKTPIALQNWDGKQPS